MAKSPRWTIDNAFPDSPPRSKEPSDAQTS